MGPCLCGGCERCIPGIGAADELERRSEEWAASLGLVDHFEWDDIVFDECDDDEVDELIASGNVVFFCYYYDELFDSWDIPAFVVPTERAKELWNDCAKVSCLCFARREELPESHKWYKPLGRPNERTPAA